MIRHPLSIASLLFVSAFHAVMVHAAPANLDALLRNSPFGGPAASAAAGKTDTPLEFRGVLVDSGETFFSLYETSSRSSLWVGANEPGNPFMVQSYDSAKGTVTVEYQGRTLTLPLKQSKVVALVQNAPVPPGVPAPAKAATATPVEEAARLSAVAEEIRRRRALRQQQTAQPNVPNPPPQPPRN